MNKTAVVIPVFNPEPGLVGLCRELKTEFTHVIVVDDGSCEHQNDFLQLPLGCELVRHKKNRGKGAAIKTGIEYVRTCHPDVLIAVFCDGDGQHRSHDVKRVAAHAIETGRVTFGVRNFKHDDIPFRSRFGNVLTSFFVRKIFHCKIYDTQTGLRAIPARLFPAMLKMQGMRYEYEMRIFGLLRDMCEALELVPIDTVYIESNRASHFRPIIDSARVYYGLFGDTFLRFCGSSLLGFVTDNVVFTFCMFLVQSQGWLRRQDIFVSLACARAISATLNYLCNRWLVFRGSTSALLSSYIRYWSLVVAIGSLSYAGTALLSAWFDARGLAVTAIKIFVETVLFVVSYRCQKKWIFKV